VIAPFALTGLSFAPPAQDFFLGFRPDGVASTTQISLGTNFTMECWFSLYPIGRKPGKGLYITGL